MSENYGLILWIPVLIIVFLLFALYKIFYKKYILNIYRKLNTKFFPESIYEKRKLGETFNIDSDAENIFILNKFITPYTIRHLKKAVSSSNDEIRVTAFSMLSSMEREMMEKIAILKEKLKKDSKNFFIYYMLAKLYWELIYLGINDEELESFYIEEAEKYINEALSIKRSINALLLASKIALRKGDIKIAEGYIREIKEKNGNYEMVKTLLCELKAYKLAKYYKSSEEVRIMKA